MIKVLKLTSITIFLVFILTGCTHKIDMVPNVEKVTDNVFNIEKRNYNVAYILKSYEQDKYVVTPGGGGDKIGYTPYDDTELAFRTILSKVFNKVYKLEFNDSKFVKEKDIRLIFTYNLKTNSSSESMFTWPPTKFTISLNCKAVSKDGSKVWEDTIYDEGSATFSEFKSNFSLAAQRASEKVFTQLLQKINNNKKF